MNNNSPYSVYVGISPEGELAMFLTEYPLHPLGSRLLKTGQKFPDSVLDIYDVEIPLTRENILSALRAASAFLNNEQESHATPVFGEDIAKHRRKKST